METDNSKEPPAELVSVHDLSPTSAIVKVKTRTKGIVGYIVPTQELFPIEDS